MPDSMAGRTNDAKKQRQQSRGRTGKTERREAQNAGNDAHSNAALGGGFDRETFERHSAMLAHGAMSHPVNAEARARMVRQIQRDYGNKYVQRLVDHVSAKTGHSSQEAQRQTLDEDEESIQAKAVIQREILEQDELGEVAPPEMKEVDDLLQAKRVVRRQSVDEDELAQTKPSVQRQTNAEVIDVSRNVSNDSGNAIQRVAAESKARVALQGFNIDPQTFQYTVTGPIRGQIVPFQGKVDAQDVFDKTGNWRMVKFNGTEGFLKETDINFSVKSQSAVGTAAGAYGTASDVYSATAQSSNVAEIASEGEGGSLLPKDAIVQLLTKLAELARSKLGEDSQWVVDTMTWIRDKLSKYSIPIIGTVIKGIVGTIDKFIDLRALKKARDDAFDGTLSDRPQPDDFQLHLAADYGYAKVKRGFFERAARTALSLGQAIARIITILSGGVATLVTEAVDLGLQLVKAANSVFKKVKGFWKWFTGKRGKGRALNANTIVEAARKGNERAAKLIHTINPTAFFTKWARRFKRSYPTEAELEVQIQNMDDKEADALKKEVAIKLKSN